MSVHGALVLDKARGPTSFKALKGVCRALGVKTAGHAGTLDPMASGVLVVLLGEAMKLSALVMDHDKEYEAEITFGVGTDTLDAEGEVVERVAVPAGVVTRERIEAAAASMIGDVSQVPPRYSALKVDGRTNMSRARNGEDFEVAPRTVRCDAIEVLRVDGDKAVLRVACGKGYYVRALARDLGLALTGATAGEGGARAGLPAHLSALRRTRVGAFDLARAVTVDAVTPSAVLPIPEVVPQVAHVVVSTDEMTALRAGRLASWPAGLEAEVALALGPSGEPLALVERLDSDPTRPPRMKVRRGFVPMDPPPPGDTGRTDD
jgi:tRNA pseudouridine55 synthase